MSVEAVGLLTLLIGVVSLFRTADFALGAFAPLTLLGSAAAVLLGGSGTIQPAHLMLGFLVASVVASQGHLASIARSVSFPREGFWLAVLVGYGLAGAFLLPRVFAGATGINAIGTTDDGPSLLLVPLGPTSGNVTQSIYLVADVACFLAVRAIASTPAGLLGVVKALLAYAAANVAFAALDVATAATDSGYLLAFIRNAEYQLHVDETTAGLRRIVGSFTETSSFSYATIGSLAFTAHLCLCGRWVALTGALSLASLGLLAASTSSTAYVATPVVLLILYAGALARAARQRAAPSALAFLAFAPLVATLALLLVALVPPAAEAVQALLDVTLFDKSASQSGAERAEWNRTALQNFVDTSGLGGGLGSIRASSFPLAVLANLGIVGAICFLAFFATVFAARDQNDGTSLSACARSAGKTACAGLLVAATVSGALVDLGLIFYVFAAMASTLPLSSLAAATSPPEAGGRGGGGGGRPRGRACRATNTRAAASP